MTGFLAFLTFVNIALGNCRQADVEVTGFRDLPDNNVSQLMRSNSKDFWSWLNTISNLPAFRKFFESEGAVFGDAHVSNFHVLPILGRMRFLFFDFDDGGYASFFGDFARFVAVTKATKKKINAEDLVRAHLAGLKNEGFVFPKRIAKALSVSNAEYLVKRRRYVDRKRKGEKLRMDRSELRAISEAESKTVAKAFRAAFSNVKVLDVVAFDKPRGGSAQSSRYWVLVKTKQGELPYDLYEVKELIEPGTQAIHPQLGPIDRLKYQKEHLWGFDLLADLRYSHTIIEGKAFEIRPKKINLFQVTNKNYEKMALFTAYYMGFVYSLQDSALTYKRTLEADFNGAVTSLEWISDAYKRRATDYFENKTN